MRKIEVEGNFFNSIAAVENITNTVCQMQFDLLIIEQIHVITRSYNKKKKKTSLAAGAKSYKHVPKETSKILYFISVVLNVYISFTNLVHIEKI